VEESLREHQTLMQALAARNPTMSRQAMQAHFANGLEAASPDAHVPQSTPPQVVLATAVG